MFKSIYTVNWTTIICCCLFWINYLCKLSFSIGSQGTEPKTLKHLSVLILGALIMSVIRDLIDYFKK
jgi:hypothetical protein